MRILVIGAGQVGTTVVEALHGEAQQHAPVEQVHPGFQRIVIFRIFSHACEVIYLHCL